MTITVLSVWKHTRLLSFILLAFICFQIVPPLFGMLECLPAVVYISKQYNHAAAQGWVSQAGYMNSLLF